MKTYRESKIKFTKLWNSQNVKKSHLKSTSSVSICSYNSHGFENQSRYGDLENSLGRGNLQIEVVKNVKYFSKIRMFFSKLFLFGPPISLPQSKLNERKVLLSSPVFVSLSFTSNAGCCACSILFSFLYIRKDWGCEVMTSRLVFSAGRVTKVYESTLALTILLVNMKAIFAVIITT